MPLACGVALGAVVTVPDALERVRRHLLVDRAHYPAWERYNTEYHSSLAEVVEWFDQLPPRHCVSKSVLVNHFGCVPHGVSRIAPDGYQCTFSGLHKDVWPLLNPDG